MRNKTTTGNEDKYQAGQWAIKSNFNFYLSPSNNSFLLLFNLLSIGIKQNFKTGINY
ncbi:hypothetical protein JCM15548_13978 [Geofilum rubicundum JCM 15548]|uniref:Uncharacterized protein n=1 Tax=Geofilum rubicundum JCM 15548 TaxID=1236989 RepID=A0A0E9M2J5_9BACT|nr:hypothetical protein JCM15548_13978 [Geofilum rubicundum JCM 15548]